MANSRPTEGFHVGPNELVVVTSSIVHRYQKETFKKAKCVHDYGTDIYTFTGEPFEVAYNTHSCVDLCYAQAHYNVCSCAAFIGWNLTRTKCLEEHENRQCLFNASSYNATEYMELRESVAEKVNHCALKCYPRCDQKLLQTHVLRKNQKWTSYHLKETLQAVAHKDEANDTISKRFLLLLETYEQEDSRVNDISKRMSQVIIRLANEPVTVVTIVPLVNFSTFISNVGGILGMCLGLSVVSVFEIIEKNIFCSLMSQRREEPETDVKIKKKDETTQKEYPGQ